MPLEVGERNEDRAGLDLEHLDPVAAGVHGVLRNDEREELTASPAEMEAPAAGPDAPVDGGGKPAGGAPAVTEDPRHSRREDLGAGRYVPDQIRVRHPRTQA